MIRFLRRMVAKINKYHIWYDSFMAVLAVGIFVSLIIDSHYSRDITFMMETRYFDKFVWLVFTIDYIVRLLVARDRFAFVRHNLIDLIAILPFDLFFQGIRALRLVRLLLMLRAFAYLNRAYMRIGKVLQTNNFDHVLWFTFCTIFIGAMSISFIDDMDIGDAFWWSFVTTTTVGYGDIAPKSLGGRLVAVCLMIVGIGFLSTLTGTISTFLINNINAKKKHATFKEREINTMIDELRDFDNMTKEDIDDMYRTLLMLKATDTPSSPKDKESPHIGAKGRIDLISQDH